MRLSRVIEKKEAIERDIALLNALLVEKQVKLRNLKVINKSGKFQAVFVNNDTVNKVSMIKALRDIVPYTLKDTVCLVKNGIAYTGTKEDCIFVAGKLNEISMLRHEVPCCGVTKR